MNSRAAMLKPAKSGLLKSSKHTGFSLQRYNWLGWKWSVKETRHEVAEVGYGAGYVGANVILSSTVDYINQTFLFPLFDLIPLGY